MIADLTGLKKEIHAIKKRLTGNPVLEERYIESIPPIVARLAASQSGFAPSSHGPTKTQREQFDIARRELDEISPQVDAIATTKILDLRSRLMALGIELTVGE
jgi:hypothetical protein